MMTLNSALRCLGLEPGASRLEIIKAYRKLALENHPDKKGGSTEKMQEINEAKETLDSHAAPAQMSTPAQTSVAHSVFRPPTQEELKQAESESCRETLNKILRIFQENMPGSTFFNNVANNFYNKNLAAILAFSKRKTPISIPGVSKPQRPSQSDRLIVLMNILDIVKCSHDDSRMSQNLSYITQDLLDFLLSTTTNLSEVDATFNSLYYLGNLNITTIDFVINKPAYSSILASTIAHVVNISSSNDSEVGLKEKSNFILDFYKSFPVDSMPSIEFEAELLEAENISDIDAVIGKYQTILESQKAQTYQEEVEINDSDTLKSEAKSIRP